jgi:hypothetical protein
VQQVAGHKHQKTSRAEHDRSGSQSPARGGSKHEKPQE